MDLNKFAALMGTFHRKQLGQDPHEWRCFLEFISAYFENRGVTRPLIVEIGVWNGLQRRFYEQLLNAEYIGIDNGKPFAPVTIKGGCIIPDIEGDSHNPKTVEKLKVILAGRQIDLLFIDGDHSYESAKTDYELYGPLAKYIIVFHDIFCVQYGVHQFWNELMAKEKNRSFVMFKKDSSADWTYQMGIGLLIKAE